MSKANLIEKPTFKTFCYAMKLQKKLKEENLTESETDRIQRELEAQFVQHSRTTLYFMGFTSEATPYEKQVKIYSPMFPGFRKDTHNIVYPWHALKDLFTYPDIFKGLWNRIFACTKCKMMTTYRRALDNTFSDSDNLYKTFESCGMYLSPEINLVGYSLGTQLIFNLLVKLQLANDGHKEEADRNYKVNNVVFMAGVLSCEWLYTQLAKFLGKNGVIKGRIIIIQSKHDLKLRVLVGKFYVNSRDRDFDDIEEFNNDPVGGCYFSHDNAAKFIDRSIEPFNKMNLEEIKKFLEDKIKIVDASTLKVKSGEVKTVSHPDYVNDDIFAEVCNKVTPLLNKI